jgi:hypothetical protein
MGFDVVFANNDRAHFGREGDTYKVHDGGTLELHVSVPGPTRRRRPDAENSGRTRQFFSPTAWLHLVETEL